MSNQCGRSQKLRLREVWLVVGWILVALIIYLSLRPGPLSLTATLNDKMQHVMAYAVLMFWFGNLYLRKSMQWRYAVGFVLLGVALEFIQLASGYRSFDPGDMVADAIGVTAGWLLAPPRTPPMLEAIESLVFRLKAGDDI